MSLDDIKDYVRVFWFSTLLVWLVFYLRIQLERLPLLGNSKFLEQMKKHIMESREITKSKFLRYMGIIWEEAFVIYPIRSLLAWLFLFVFSVYIS